MIGFIGGPEIVILSISSTIVGLWLWSLIHCITNKNLTSTMKIIGVILIVALSLLGSLIYLGLPREEQ